MRLAHFVHAYPESTETFISRQVEGLRARGHGVDVFTHGEPLHLDPDVAGAARVVQLEGARSGLLSSRAPAAAAALRAAGCALRHPRAARVWLARGGGRLRRRIATLPRAATLAGQGPYSVVHCHYGDVGLSDGAAARLWDAPLVVSFYGYDCSSFVRAHGPAVYRALFAAVDLILVLGAAMRARLEALGAPRERIAIQPLGVDPAAYAPGPAPEPHRILTVARLVPKKGIDAALRAVAALAPEFPDLRYEIIGDGPLRAELEGLARGLGLAARVRFAGLGTQPEVRRAMRRASLFLLPSRTAPDGDEEGTPTVLLEAASAGLPVVSTRHAGIPDIVADGDTGLLAAESDLDGLTALLRRLLDSGELRRRMGAAARRRVLLEHDAARLAARLEGHYEEAERNASMRLANGPRCP